jgi:hypothetical protein
MIEFFKTISASEINTRYINLTDNRGNTWGRNFPENGTRLCIIDEKGQEFSTTKHGNNQLWGNLVTWFVQRNIQPETLVKIIYDPTEIRNERPVVHIEIQNPQLVNITPDNTDTEEIESDNSSIEISIEFEKQLENFLKDNLNSIENRLRIFKDNEGHDGQQYPTDVGRIDLLCIDENNDFVIIELKKKRTSDVAVGQILRYMGWVNQNLNKEKKVRGIIITPEIDVQLEFAASMVPNVQVKYYRIRLDFITKADLENN